MNDKFGVYSKTNKFEAPHYITSSARRSFQPVSCSFQRKCSHNKMPANTHANGKFSRDFAFASQFWPTYSACRHSGPSDSSADCVPCGATGRSWRWRVVVQGGVARLGLQTESKVFSNGILNFRQTVCGLCIFGFSVARLLIAFALFRLCFSLISLVTVLAVLLCSTFVGASNGFLPTILA